MKLFVDDERPMPVDGGWIISKTAAGAIDTMQWVRENPGNWIDILSLDHDLGENVPTGYDVAVWVERQVYLDGMIPPKVLKVHSANPVGRARILQTFQSIARYCERNGMQIPKIEG
jgi:hypothetical protein